MSKRSGKSSERLDTPAKFRYLAAVRILTFLFCSTLVFGQTTDWPTTNQVEVLTPGVNVPGVTVPEIHTVEIPEATNAPPAPVRPVPRPPEAYQPIPRPEDLARKAVVIRPLALPQPTAVSVTNIPGASETSGTNLALAPAEPVLFNTPEAEAILADLQIFPADNPWHQNIETWPLHPNSKNIVQSIGANETLRYNLDMSFVLIPTDQPRVDVDVFLHPAESDPGPFPIPNNVPIEGWPAYYTRAGFAKRLTLDDVQRDRLNLGGDRHAIVVDPGRGLLYEFFLMRKMPTGWRAGQASIFDLKTNKLRPDGWTSADAAGLPIFPAIVRYDELKRGVIDHALRVTVRQSRREYVAPATHYASTLTDPNLPRMGERLRLKRNFDLTGFAPEVRTILTALKTYGMFVADNGSIFALSIAPDERMPASLDQLGRLTASDFEVVTSPR